MIVKWGFPPYKQGAYRSQTPVPREYPEAGRLKRGKPDLLFLERNLAHGRQAMADAHHQISLQVQISKANPAQPLLFSENKTPFSGLKTTPLLP